ncbi:DUF5000 domain-containing lipoprotein [Parapedobacter tibetensis]|uniref:DUF5000 domain-containing lipoprotein n=1 Tax=Parapedobacter tibetensis TaxID=2972951 RepID=UPI00214D1BDC|nr:DUF5000 domain-containing lipoprotein [Parapedobacter tibetensis]
MNTYKTLIIFGIALLFLRCSEERLKPVNDDDHVPPPVSNVQVENIPGGASIAYNLPPGGKTLYVLAEWDLANGQVATAQASYYSNSVRVEGFGDTQARSIRLYTVGRNQKRSTLVTVQVNPLTPPIQQIIESFDIHEDFGGLRMDFANIHEADVAIEVSTVDDLGDWVSVEIFYTKRLEGRLFVRGFDAEEHLFGFTVRDRWGNTTDMRTKTITPLFEKELDKSLFRTIPALPGEMGVYSGSALSNIWSGNYMGDNSIPSNSFFRSANALTLPAHLTFDLGVTAKLGRYVLWQRGAYVSPYTFTWSGGGPRRWEVWGRADLPTTGSMDGWTKLMDCEIIKPSGTPPGTTPVPIEDVELAQAGHEFSFDPDLPTVRYIRIRLLSNWGGLQYINFAEVSFFGDPGQ